jgi:hypothetical protein
MCRHASCFTIYLVATIGFYLCLNLFQITGQEYWFSVFVYVGTVYWFLTLISDGLLAMILWDVVEENTEYE